MPVAKPQHLTAERVCELMFDAPHEDDRRIVTTCVNESDASEFDGLAFVSCQSDLAGWHRSARKGWRRFTLQSLAGEVFYLECDRNDTIKVRVFDRAYYHHHILNKGAKP